MKGNFRATRGKENGRERIDVEGNSADEERRERSNGKQTLDNEGTVKEQK